MFFQRLQLLQQGTRKTQGLAEPSEARNRAIVLGLAMLLVPPLLFYFYLKTKFSGLTYLDALDFAQLGRNLSEGHGFVTEILRPLALTHGNDPLHQPDVTHGPLFPFVLALFFGALGANDIVAADVSGIFYLLTIPVLYFLGTRMFGRSVGLLTTAVFTFNTLFLEYAISGTYDTLYIFLMTCLLFVLYNIAVQMQAPLGQVKEITEEADSTRKAGEPVRAVGKVGLKPKAWTKGAALPKMQVILAGLLTGLLYLTDPIFFWIIPVLLGAIAILGGARRGQALVQFAAPLCLLVLPWMWRNAMLTGNPVFGLRGMELWMYTKDAYPGLIAYRMMPSDLAPGVDLFKSVVQKIILNLDAVIQTFIQVSASWILAFFLPCLLFRFSNGAANILRRILLSCCGALLFGMLLFGIQMPLFVSLIPAMLIFSVAYLLYLLQQAQLNRFAMGTLNALLALTLILPLVTATAIAGKTPALPDMMRASVLGRLTKPNDVILSDQPWIVAWYADRPSVWIPAGENHIVTLRKQFPSTNWLFLTDQAANFSPDYGVLSDYFHRWNQKWLMAHNDAQDHAEALAKNNPTPDGQVKFLVVPPIQEIDSVPKGVIPPLLSALNGLTTVGPVEQANPSMNFDKQKQRFVIGIPERSGQSGGSALSAASGSFVTSSNAAVGKSNTQPIHQYNYANPEVSFKYWKARLNARPPHRSPKQRPVQ